MGGGTKKVNFEYLLCKITHSVLPTASSHHLVFKVGEPRPLFQPFILTAAYPPEPFHSAFR